MHAKDSFSAAQATGPVYGQRHCGEVHLLDDVGRQESTAQRVFYGAMDQVAKKTNTMR